MSYEVSDLQVLSDSQSVRTRPGMFIGDSYEPSPLFNEIFDNAVDEAQAGFSNLTSIYVDYDKNVYSITDNGRGFPQGLMHDPTSDRDFEALELLCTKSFSGGKFSSQVYKISSGLHGVGLLVTNSLSEYFKVDTWRSHSHVIYESSRGETSSLNYKDSSGDSESGTKVDFIPDPQIFSDIKIPLSHIVLRCKIASSFGMKCKLVVKENDNEKEIDTEATIYDLLPPEDENISEYYRYDFTVKDQSTGEFAAVALKYTSDTKSYYRGYTNLLYNSNGGSHHKMLDGAVYDAWQVFKIQDIKWNDIYLGLRAVIAVFISDTEFSSQSKERLSVKSDKLAALKTLITEKIVEWLKNNDVVRESLIKRFQEYRLSQNKLLARKEIKSLLVVNNSKNGTIRRTSPIRKLRDCSSNKRDGTELGICEGDSALGGIVRARDPVTQAVLPVRGKVLNVSRLENINDALKNEEIRSIVNAIGAGIGDTCDPSKSRYEKIVFYTDADADGLEIRVLLSGIFINLLPSLVKEGMVYTSIPPLYGWKDKQGYHFTNNIKDVPSKVELYRYKGLGEMDPDELKISTMDPSTRRLVKINYPDDINIFNSILTSSSVKFKMLEDLGVIRYE